MEKIKLLIALLFLMTTSEISRAISFDFENTVYFTDSSGILVTSGQSLATFNYSTASALHPLLNTGVYFPFVDYQGNNLWLRVRHIADDPNGTSVGHNVTATVSSPFYSGGFGGWFGFQYEFDIYKDQNMTGARNNILNGLQNCNITIESIETLSNNEWVSFEITNNINSYWILNSVNFTGLNPTSRPGFSAVNIPIDGNIPPTGFDTIFPGASNSIYVVDYNSNPSYAEFRASANNVSQFKYGYEYSTAGGYQGMHMEFGTVPAIGVREINEKIKIQLSPNPAMDFVIIHSGSVEPMQMKITDAIGKVISSSKIESFPAKIDVKKLSNGIYFVILNNGADVVKKQLVIAR